MFEVNNNNLCSFCEVAISIIMLYYEESIVSGGATRSKKKFKYYAKYTYRQ